MNYLRNLLRKLWPFVTRREHDEMFEKFMSKVDTQAIRINQITTWVRILESKYDVLAKGVDDEVHTLVSANNLVCNRLDKLEVEAAKLKTVLDYITSNVYRRDEPKKKPSRRKPAKKGKKK